MEECGREFMVGLAFFLKRTEAVAERLLDCIRNGNIVAAEELEIKRR